MEAKLEMNRMHKKVDFEGVGDSELLNPPPIRSTVALSIAAADAAAKSTSGSVDNDSDGDSAGDVISCSSSSSSSSSRKRRRMRERKEPSHRKGEEKRVSWRSWLIEYAARRDVIDRQLCRDDDDDDKETGSTTTTTTAAAAGAEAERSRLFWEACFAHGY